MTDYLTREQREYLRAHTHYVAEMLTLAGPSDATALALQEASQAVEAEEEAEGREA